MVLRRQEKLILELNKKIYDLKLEINRLKKIIVEKSEKQPDLKYEIRKMNFDYIFDLIPSKGSIKMGDFFKLAKKNGYVQSYKSFQRDVKLLTRFRPVLAEKKYSKNGTTTLISLKSEGIA